MNKQSKIKNIRGKIEKVDRRIRLCYNYKNKLVNFVYDLKLRLENNQISFDKYYHYLNKGLSNRPLDSWLKEYDNYIEIYSDKIREYNLSIDRLSKGPNKIVYLIPVLIVALMIGSFIFFKPETTGYVTFGEVVANTDKVSLGFNNSSEYVWIPTKPGKLNSVMLSGEITGKGYAKIYLVTDTKDYLIYYKEEGKDKVNLSRDCMESCYLNHEQESYKLRFELKDTEVRLDSIEYFAVDIIDLDMDPKTETIIFEPGLYTKKTFRILNSENKDFNVVVYVEGVLNNSITLHNSFVEFEPDKEFEEIEYEIVLPKEMDLGVHKTKIIARYVPDGHFTGTAPTAELEIIMNVSDEDRYIEKIEAKEENEEKKDNTFIIVLAVLILINMVFIFYFKIKKIKKKKKLENHK